MITHIKDGGKHSFEDAVLPNSPAERRTIKSEGNTVQKLTYNFGQVFSAAEERAVFIDYDSAKSEEEKLQLREKIVDANMRLVLSIARRYAATCKNIPLDDFMQEGLIGLSRAIEKFDVDKGFKFSTYATHWIRQGISRYADKNRRLLKVPIHAQADIGRITRTRDEITSQGTSATSEAIASQMGIKCEEVERLTALGTSELSLDELIGEGDDTHLENLADLKGIDPMQAGVAAHQRSQLLKAIHMLPQLEQKVLLGRFPIEGGLELGIKELADELKMSRQGVHLVQTRALRKLRGNDQSG